MNEIVLILGYPASGKTTVSQEFTENGYHRLNRDTTGGTVDALAMMIERDYNSGTHSFVLDNLFPTRASRAPFLAAGKKLGLPVRCVQMGTSIEDAQVNACIRMIRLHGKLLSPEQIRQSKNPGDFGPVVLFSYRKDFEEPEKKEGFAEIEHREFVRKWPADYTNKALLLDYDGSLRITKSGDKYPCTPADISILPGRKPKLEKFVKDGYKLLGISNQSGVAKGVLTHDECHSCFVETNRLLGLDIEIGFCPHRVPPLSCFCRKPMPGLAVQYVEKYKLSPSHCTLVGDMTTDKTCASRIGMKFIHSDIFFG